MLIAFADACGEVELVVRVVGRAIAVGAVVIAVERRRGNTTIVKDNRRRSSVNALC